MPRKGHNLSYTHMIHDKKQRHPEVKRMLQCARMAHYLSVEYSQSTSPDAPFLASSMRDVRDASIHALQQLSQKHAHEALQPNNAR
jgi:arginine/lysine/ornithine decarboxylase